MTSRLDEKLSILGILQDPTELTLQEVANNLNNKAYDYGTLLEDVCVGWGQRIDICILAYMRGGTKYFNLDKGKWVSRRLHYLHEKSAITSENKNIIDNFLYTIAYTDKFVDDSMRVYPTPAMTKKIAEKREIALKHAEQRNKTSRHIIKEETYPNINKMLFMMNKVNNKIDENNSIRKEVQYILNGIKDGTIPDIDGMYESGVQMLDIKETSTQTLKDFVNSFQLL